MHKHWSCSCGYLVHGNSDEDIVRQAQDHMKKEHKKDAGREEILKSAKEARH